MHKALYREYRPLVFDDVIGQDHIIRTLERVHETKNHLLCGCAIKII